MNRIPVNVQQVRYNFILRSKQTNEDIIFFQLVLQVSQRKKPISCLFSKKLSRRDTLERPVIKNYHNI